VSKIDSFKVLQTVIIQGLKRKTNSDSVVKVSTEDLLSATTEQIQFGTGFDGSVLEGNHQVHHLLKLGSVSPTETKRIICSAKRVFEHYSEEQNCFSFSISVNVH